MTDEYNSCREKAEYFERRARLAKRDSDRERYRRAAVKYRSLVEAEPERKTESNREAVLANC